MAKRSTETGEGGSKALPSFTQVAEFYDHLMRSVPYRWWMAYVEELLVKFNKGPNTALDLACGTGNFTFLLAEKGYRAVGVDNSEGMLRVARQKAKKRRLPVPFLLQDATQLSFKPSFDLVVSVFDSLNYVIGEEKLRRAFQGVFEACLPGGVFIFDVNTIRALELDLFTQDNLKTSDWLKYDWTSHWDPETKICTIDMAFKVLSEGRELTFQETHYQMGYELEEIKKMLEGVGFRVLAVYDAYQTVKANRHSTRAFFVAEKPSS